MDAPLVWRKLSLYLIDEWLVAGVSLCLPGVAPVPYELLDGGFKLVHVKRGGGLHLPLIVLKQGAAAGNSKLKPCLTRCLECR